MKIRVIATTNTKNFMDKNEFDKFSGIVAGVCYMKNTFEDLENQPETTIFKRAERTKNDGHHSVFDHEYISLYLENVPKFFAMLLNNEKVYTTSEKSARYTQMQMEGVEKFYYEKWLDILKIKIKDEYGKYPCMTEQKIEKLAQENARYYLSVFMPTSMVYTVSYRQLNYIYNWLQNEENYNSKITQKLYPYAMEFCKQLKESNLIDEKLVDGKGRNFSMFSDISHDEYFGDVYSTNYKGSLASFAQAQRHRTINYSISMQKEKEFYVPRIIEKDEALKNEWLKDMQEVKDLFPQAEIVNISERGIPEDFILKAKERLCTHAQLEIMEQTKNTLNKYIQNVKNSKLKEYLLQYSKGARCTFPDYVCNNKCNFSEGVNLTRRI